MGRVELVYCAGGNPGFATTALAAGFRYGVQLPDTAYAPPWFADQDWRRPERQRYMAALALHRPHMATVLDWERLDQLPEVLDWAEEAAQYAEAIVIIPKVMGEIGRLPRQIGGSRVVLGYSVPTRFAGTSLPLWEFDGWPLHLLGGQPHTQMRLWRYFSCRSEVASCDGNFANAMAVKYCQFWTNGDGRGRNRWWTTLTEADGVRWTQDAPAEAFRRSCTNIVAAWRRLEGSLEDGS